MEQVFIGRQPILNKNENTFGYELLFRKTSCNNANVFDHTEATATVISNLMNSIGFNKLVGQKKAFINVNEKILSDGFIELLPRENTVLEILEHVDVSSGLIELCTNLKDNGHLFALDDFVYSDDFLPLLKIADFVKIDIMMYSKKELEDIVTFLSKFSSRLLAEKVETKDDYRLCNDLGFEFFQGYFFEKPSVVTGRTISPSQLVLFELFNNLSKEEDVNIIERNFKKNPQLDIKLLKFINSAAFYLTQQIDSIRHAIAMLGYRNLQKWVALMLFTKESGNTKSNPLLEMAAMRGLIMEHIAIYITKSRTTGDSAFITGILSLADTLLGIPLDNIIADLNLTNEIYEALSKRDGFLGDLLQITENFNKDDFYNIRDMLNKYRLDIKDLLAAETKAIIEFENLDGT